ncbi:hypothetical protein B0H15DRAFT_198944 [Mycena belliarum]|uniref:Uncharacterized protein n=1 Tax=Mycena belliarum TaxID=1033014 RepID=A0AAD6XVY2_9AGAR|nr:hypothetical protein B0H15DRAFT_198944 [Mycena belliae]
MPRPTPLSSASASYPRFDPRFDAQLTPRTPHSRAGRAEEAYSAAELEQIDFDGDYNSVIQQQNVPLLSSSASDSFPQVGYRSRGDDYESKDKSIGLGADKIIARLPLALYSSVAAVLLVLVFFSLREPEALRKYVGATSGAPIASTANITLISYENYTSFPLDPIEYRAECIKLNTGLMKPYPYWDAVLQGARDVLHHDEQPGYEPPPGEPPVCTRTITYQLDGWAGLTVDLALIAQAAALARERNATFFVDDRFWNRGKWEDHFQQVRLGQPGPEPGCRPPPPEEFVACPRTARHWIVNSRTSRYHFGHAFAENYQDPYGHGLNRFKDMYYMAGESLQQTIRPSARSAELIKLARQELSEKVNAHYQNPRTAQGVQYKGPAKGYLGVHIRRGDRQRSWLVYNQSYVPIADYVDGVVDAWSRLGLEHSADNNRVQPFVYIASDSPAAVKEFAASFSPDRVFSLSGSKREELRALASPGEYWQEDFALLAEHFRVAATRGMIVDFAVLTGAWAEHGDLIADGTVCAVSSVVCKLAAIPLGWTRAFGAVSEMGMMEKAMRRWVDVDVQGRVVPVWEAFQAY